VLFRVRDRVRVRVRVRIRESNLIFTGVSTSGCPDSGLCCLGLGIGLGSGFAYWG